MDKKWWHNACVYQIYPRSFKDSNNDGIGDIQGIIEKIPYIKTLGSDILWLCPMYVSPQADNGYDIRDYKQIDPIFGTIDDMQELLDECKKRDIHVIMDLVVNHTSDEHMWFQEAIKSKDNEYHNYYIWRDEPNELQSNFGGSAWEYVPEVNQYYLHLYSKKQPDLNWENPTMRNSIYEMMSWWIDKGISGFRMDVIDLIGKQPDQMIKENGPLLHNYLQEMYQQVLQGKDLFTVGETWGATIDNANLYCDPNRNELCMIFQFEQIQLDKIAGKQRWDLKPLDVRELKQVLSKWQIALMDHGWNALFWNNHDLPRIISRWGNDTNYREVCAKMFATLLHGMKGTPFIYQGEEIGMCNAHYDNFADFTDIETQSIIKERLKNGYKKEDILYAIQKKARDNARTPMQWNQSKYAGFSQHKPWLNVNKNYTSLHVEQNLQDKNSVFYHYQKLIALRKEYDVLVYGDYTLLYEDDEDIFAYKRSFLGKILLVVCNFHDTTRVFQYENTTQLPTVLISNYKDTQTHLQNLILRPFEAAMFYFEKGE